MAHVIHAEGLYGGSLDIRDALDTSSEEYDAIIGLRFSFVGSAQSAAAKGVTPNIVLSDDDAREIALHILRRLGKKSS